MFAVSLTKRILKFQRTSPINWWNYHTLLICLCAGSLWNFGLSSNKRRVSLLIEKLGSFSFISFTTLSDLFTVSQQRQDQTFLLCEFDASWWWSWFLNDWIANGLCYWTQLLMYKMTVDDICSVLQMKCSIIFYNIISTCNMYLQILSSKKSSELSRTKLSRYTHVLFHKGILTECPFQMLICR